MGRLKEKEEQQKKDELEEEEKRNQRDVKEKRKIERKTGKFIEEEE